MRRSFYVFLFFVLVIQFGCGPREEPNFTYMPDMAHSPALKAQEEGSMRTPVKGTIPRGFKKYRYANDPQAAASVKNPLPRTKEVLMKGKEQFNIYCTVCHGERAKGDGTIVPKYPRPPSLHSSKVKNWADGRIFHVITMGQNLMPSYASQVDPEDRWAIIHYLRALQKASSPTKGELEKAKNW